jgi:5-methylcytosine-specific restriction enzyme A
VLGVELSTRRTTAGVYSRKRPLGPLGERLCYNCGGPLPKGKPFNCSSECSEEWRGKTSPSYMRYLILKRDKGVCAHCGLDTVALRKEYDAIRKAESSIERRDENSPRNQFIKAHGIPWGRVSTDWWDADHIEPVVEGGGECGLSNFRTLCIPCHAKETRELAARRAKRRHEAKPLPLLDWAYQEASGEATMHAGGDK